MATLHRPAPGLSAQRNVWVKNNVSACRVSSSLSILTSDFDDELDVGESDNDSQPSRKVEGAEPRAVHQTMTNADNNAAGSRQDPDEELEGDKDAPVKEAGASSGQQIPVFTRERVAPHTCLCTRTGI